MAADGGKPASALKELAVRTIAAEIIVSADY